MSPVFKDFLQGVLTKNPKQRLAWPELLHHPFVEEFVKGIKLSINHYSNRLATVKVFRKGLNLNVGSAVAQW